MVLAFDKQLYSKNALIKAAFQFTNVAYLHLRQDASHYYIDVTSKKNEEDTQNSVDELKICDELKNEMLAQTMHNMVFEETKSLREIILGRALSSTMIFAKQDNADKREANFDKNVDIDVHNNFDANHNGDTRNNFVAGHSGAMNDSYEMNDSFSLNDILKDWFEDHAD